MTGVKQAVDRKKLIANDFAQYGNGYVICDPTGPFQQFLLRIEDAFLTHLWSDGTVRDISSKIKSLCGKVDPWIYVVDEVGSFRAALRLLASQSPHNFFETVEGLVDEICSKPFNKQILKQHALSLKQLISRSFGFVLLVDDPFAGVLHFHRPAATAAFFLRLSGCGTPFVNGNYHSVGEIGNMTFKNASGSVITRTVKSVQVPNGAGSMSEVSLFIWLISDSNEGLAVFSCCSIDPSPTPPVAGWRVCRPVGRGPPPDFAVFSESTEFQRLNSISKIMTAAAEASAGENNCAIFKEVDVVLRVAGADFNGQSSDVLERVRARRRQERRRAAVKEFKEEEEEDSNEVFCFKKQEESVEEEEDFCIESPEASCNVEMASSAALDAMVSRIAELRMQAKQKA